MKFSQVVALLSLVTTTQAFLPVPPGPSSLISSPSSNGLFYSNNADIDKQEADDLVASAIDHHYPRPDSEELIRRLMVVTNNSHNHSEHHLRQHLLDDLADQTLDRIIVAAGGLPVLDKTTLRRHFDTMTSGDKNTTQNQAEEYVDTVFEVLDSNGKGIIGRVDMRAAFQKYDYRLVYETLLGMPVDELKP